jgi:hypothetical protein
MSTDKLATAVRNIRQTLQTLARADAALEREKWDLARAEISNAGSELSFLADWIAMVDDRVNEKSASRERRQR